VGLSRGGFNAIKSPIASHRLALLIVQFWDYPPSLRCGG